MRVDNKKALDNSIIENIISTVISDIQNDISKDNIYDTINNGTQNDDDNLDLVLKYYLMKKLLKQKKENVNLNNSVEEDYQKTANPNIVKSNDGKYYKLTKKGLVVCKNIIDIDKEGNYTVEKLLLHSSFYSHIKYNPKNEVTSIQLLRANGQIINSKFECIKILGLKKEYVARYKYSNNTLDNVIAKIGNAICAPIESGYYVDERCQFYTWNKAHKRFDRNTKIVSISPFDNDYEFKDNGTVLRIEYKKEAVNI